MQFPTSPLIKLLAIPLPWSILIGVDRALDLAKWMVDFNIPSHLCRDNASQFQGLFSGALALLSKYRQAC